MQLPPRDNRTKSYKHYLKIFCRLYGIQPFVLELHLSCNALCVYRSILYKSIKKLKYILKVVYILKV